MSYTVKPRTLSGFMELLPEMQYEGTGYNDKIRLLGDYGSNLYLIKEI